MGALRFLGLLITAFAVFIGVAWYLISRPSPLPKIGVEYWGPGKAKPDNPAIRPFKINISTDVLNDLNDRLELLSSLTPPLEEANFRYGFNTNYLQKVIQFWSKDYKWREREVFLNRFPQFKTQVAGLQIHFIHAKPANVPKGVKVLPIILLHGWPGSVREFYELIPLLTTPRPNVDFVFEVVAPSLPGYGFSEGASKKGLGAAQMAVIFKTLMERLNFKQFYVQGGDWGSLIGSDMATLFPDSVLGFHTNMCFITTPLSFIKMFLGSFCPNFIEEPAFSDKVYPMGKMISFILEESGYFHLQATKPDTIGVALRDSPAGLAAYILEKFSTWTEKEWRELPDGGLTKKYNLVNLLDNIMIYWATGSITTSMRMYSESFSSAQLSLKMDGVPCTVPTAIANAANEISYTPKSIAKDKYQNLVHFSHLERGGHFLAFEEPKILADDIWKAIEIIQRLK